MLENESDENFKTNYARGISGMNEFISRIATNNEIHS